MGSLDSALTRNANAKGIIVSHGSDEPVAFRLRYVGSGTVTSVTVITGTNIIMDTSDGGVDTYEFGTYTTYAALIGAINADGIFEAKVLDTLLSENPDDDIVNGVISSSLDANGVTIWDANVDTSASQNLVACLSAHRDFDAPGRIVSLKEIVYYATLGGAAANGLLVYRRRGGIETKLFGRLSISANETTIDFANGEGELTGNKDDEILVLITGSGTITDATANFVAAVGTIK